MTRLTALGAFFLLFMGISGVQAQEVPGCGNLKNGYGPFDYRDPNARTNSLPIVEDFHFTIDVETLKHGKSGPVAADIGYTLRAFPNHPRALRSIARYELEGGKFPEDSIIPSADCYFQRALAFAPDDQSVHITYANFLLKGGHKAEARQEYEEALRLAPDSAEINYNAGLFFLTMGDIERAKALAKVAYDQGYPLPGLNNKIAAAEAAGHATAAARKK